MAVNTIFFSYSRDNSDFVLNLAKDLRAAGAEVWLDQLDIAPGTRWDKSIENALRSSNTLLVVLSQTSVESNNVMDEVSYALEEGKKVVPVLLEECEIPFRLRRLQFADFTDSHDKGKKTLIKALGLEAQIADKLVGGSSSEEKVEEDKQSGGKYTPPPKQSSKALPKETVQPSVGTAATDTSRKSKKPLIYGLLVIIGLVVIWGVYKFVAVGDEDKIAFEAALDADTKEAYQNYITNYSQGKFALRVNDSLNKRIEEELIAEEDASWSNTTKTGDKTAYVIYLRDYPDGRYAQNANDSIAKIDNNAANIEADNDAWSLALNTRSVTGFLDYYMNEDVIGLHRDEALKIVDKIAEVGYLYNGKNTDGKMSNDRIFDLLCCGADVAENSVPKVNDILLTNQTRFAYRDAGTSYRNSETVKAGSKVLVLEVTNPSSNNMIVKVAY